MRSAVDTEFIPEAKFVMTDIDKNRPTAEWIEQLRARYPCEAELDRLLTRKLNRRAGPPFSPIALKTLVSAAETFIASEIKESFQLTEPVGWPAAHLNCKWRSS